MATWTSTFAVGAIVGTVTITGSFSQKDSSGNSTFSGTATLSGTTGAYMKVTSARVTFDNGAGGWTWASITLEKNIQVASVSGSISASKSFGSPTSDSSITVYGVQWSSSKIGTSDTGSKTSGSGQTLTASAWVDPNPFAKKELSISPLTATMGSNLTISETSGTGVTSVTRTWSANGSSGTFSTGSWTADLSTFEPICTTANYLDAVFTIASSGAGGSGTSSQTVRLNVPADYLPTCSATSQLINPRNNSLVAGISSIKFLLSPEVTPAENSATISSVSLLRVNTTNSALTVNSFTKSGNNFTSGVLPTISGSPSYTFSLVFRITDSRGNVLDYQTQTYRCSTFIPPYVEITNLNRVSSTSAKISVSITGTSTKKLAQIKVGSESASAINVLSSLVQTQTGYTLTDYTITGLSSGQQYYIYFYYRNQDMVTYGEASYKYSQILSTMLMPLSLYDDGSNLAVSFGEECADNYGQDCVINFAKDSYVRYIKNNTVKLLKVEDAFAQCPYNVGDIYITTLSSNPNTIWSGTTWQKLENRFLLGAGSSYNLGETGGEATHTLTINEMPAHTHTYNQAGISDVDDGGGFNIRNQSDVSSTSGSAGGGQAHNNMPPYLVVNMWKRLT